MAGGTGAPQLSGWLDDFFRSYYRHRPVNATFVGLHAYDDRLPDYSEAGIGDALSDAETLLAHLDALPPEPLDAAQQLDRRLAAGFLRIQRWELDSPHFRWANPSLHTGEAIFGVLGLLLQETVPLHDRLDRATARLDATPRLLGQARATVRNGPAAWIERALRECAAARLLFGDGLDLLLRERGVHDAGLRAAADRAIRAFGELAAYLRGDLLPRATDEYACGAEAYALLLREGHALAEDAAALEARALELMDEAEAALVAGAADFGASRWQDALARLADSHPPAETFAVRFGEVWAEARAVAVEHQLLTVPDWPVQHVVQPAWVRAAAPSLYFLPYRSPPPLDPPAIAVQYIPSLPPESATRREQALRAVNDQVIKLNYVVHHSGIGHHAQNWYAMQAPSRIGQVAAVDCAARIAMLCGGTLAEGWASYVTDLMDEVGYLTPLERYAQQYARLRMAARTVVDVRLHDGRFSLAEAADYYRERVGMAPAAAQAEAVKNSLFPATACMYLAGWDGIRRLRRALEQHEGSGFSRQRFHDRLLSFGSVPVALLAPLLLDAASSADAPP